MPQVPGQNGELGLQTEAELKPTSSMKSAPTSPEKAAELWGGMRFWRGCLRAMVQSWRHGRRGGSHALGHRRRGVPTIILLDYPLRSTDLEEACSFVPVPEEAMGHEGQIVGSECNVWSEHAPQDLVMSKSSQDLGRQGVLVGSCMTTTWGVRRVWSGSTHCRNGGVLGRHAGAGGGAGGG